MSTLPSRTPVLIVGGGPVGLMAAILLARLNVASVIVERRTSRSSAPRAHALNPRSLEICRSAGLDIEAIYQKRTPGAESAYVRFMSRLAGEEIGSLPYERQDEAVKQLTPTPLINIAQPDFEDLLIAEAATLPSIAFHFGSEWREWTERDGEVESVIQTREGEERIVSEYLLACDGSGSRIRLSLGVEMDGERTVQQLLSIHFFADIRKLVDDKPAILYWMLDPAASGTIIAYNLAGNFVFVHAYDPERESAQSFTNPRCREIVAAAIGDPSIEIDVLAANSWVMAAQVAQAYRIGRIFLAGDAAHRFPPTGGLGLNTGLGDVHNLAWKIAAVRSGAYPASLLDSYEAERRPVALANTAQSLLNQKQVGRLFESIRGARRDAPALHAFDERMADADVRAEVLASIEANREHFDSLALQLGYVYGEGDQPPPDVSAFQPTFRRGARLPHAWINYRGGRASTLDLVDPQGFVVLAGDAAKWRAAASSRQIRVIVLGEDFQVAEGDWAAQSGLESGGALLVRPDGHIAMQESNPQFAERALDEALAAPAFTGAAKRTAAHV